jgi:hypothetical protein
MGGVRLDLAAQAGDTPVDGAERAVVTKSCFAAL